MSFSDVNWLAVVVATLAGFGLGAVWYNQKVFGAAWMAELELREEKLRQGNMARIMGLSLAAYLVAAVNLAMFIGADPGIAFGAFAGFAAGFGWVAMMLAVFYLFEQRSLKVFLINAGYATVALTLMGAILAAF